MKHDPADFSHRKPHPAVQDELDQRVDALLAVLPPCPGLPSTDKEIAEADDRARADVAAGRCHDSTIIQEWLDTQPSHQSSFGDWITARNG